MNEKLRVMLIFDAEQLPEETLAAMAERCRYKDHRVVLQSLKTGDVVYDTQYPNGVKNG
jgi:hypothetical protein